MIEVRRARDIFSKRGVFREAVGNSHGRTDFDHVVEVVGDGFVKSQAAMGARLGPDSTGMKTATVGKVDPVGQRIPHIARSGRLVTTLSGNHLVPVHEETVSAGALLHLLVLNFECSSRSGIGRLPDRDRRDEAWLVVFVDVDRAVAQADLNLNISDILHSAVTNRHAGRLHCLFDRFAGNPENNGENGCRQKETRATDD